MKVRVSFALLLPLLALALQWILWPWLSPYVWFLFFPTVFFSARFAGLRAGLASTVISVCIVWYFFIPPQLSWALATPSSLYSVGLFLIMGYLISDTQDRLNCAQRNAQAALAETRAANEKITGLYRKTLELDNLKNQFFANVSHELRTPLTLIMSPLARRLTVAGLSEPERRENEMILRNARLLHRHVSDLLDTAKLEAGRMSLIWARLDLASLARGMASHFESLAAEWNIAYTVTIPDTLQVEADSEKLQRILVNLLSNAFKFTPNSGAIALHLSQADGQALLEVQDNGPGVPANLREAVFDRFHQIEGGTQRRFGGTGLGLSIVREFAELHGGGVSLVDAPGGGALFIVRLPLHAPAGTLIESTVGWLDPVMDHQVMDMLRSPAPVAAPASTQAGADAPLVLVVEDNTDMNAFIAGILHPHYRVACAFDGREGLDQALTLRPDLILCDVMMPRMNGDRMVSELRLQPSMTEVPIFMLTAKSDDELRVHMLKEGVQDYINKPFPIDELLARVGRLITERKRASDKLSKSETRFEATFEQAAVGIALVTPDGHWLRINRKLCQIVDYSQEELLALTIQDITYPDDLSLDLDYVSQILSGELQTYSIEKRYIRKDSNLVWINLTVTLVWNSDATPDYFIFIIEDIDERKQTEAALKASETTLKIAQRLAGIGNWEWDVQTDTQTWSKEIYRIYGRDMALPPATYLEVQQYFTRESWARLAAAVEKGLMEGVPYECDAEVVRPDGAHRWIIARGEAKRDTGGNVVNLYGTVQDITARKQAEIALHDREQQLSAIIGHSPSALSLKHPDGRYALANPNLQRIHKLTEDEIIGKTDFDLYPEDTALAFRANDELVLSTLTLHSVEEIVPVDGMPRNYMSHMFPILGELGTVQYICRISLDVTERKFAEQSLREREQQLQLFIEHAPVSLAMFDKQMRYLAVSRRWMDDYLLSGRETTGCSHYELFPEIPDRWKEAHRRGMSGEVTRADEDCFERNDGSVQWLRWEVRPWHTNDGAVGGIIIFSEDISLRKQDEEEIRRLNADLEQRVAERTAELTAANRELDAFAYAVSHDLRGPLRAMSGFSQAFIEDYGQLLQGEAKVYLEQIDLASRKMSELIDGLLTLSRLTRGNLQHDTVDLSALSKHLLSELMKNDPGRQMDMQVESGLLAYGDACMIEVVMRNLLDNAWKYTARAITPSIRVYAEILNGGQYFCVADNGAGFDMAHANRLFQTFQRLHRQEEFPGIGIGLATVQRIVHRHGGVIEAQGAQGKGAKFFFTLSNMPANSTRGERRYNDEVQIHPAG